MKTIVIRFGEIRPTKYKTGLANKLLMPKISFEYNFVLATDTIKKQKYLFLKADIVSKEYSLLILLQDIM